ncbi:MAG TPA: hypothetical protein VGJ13_04705 [Pseudonocardiaceae bacterium]
MSACLVIGVLLAGLLMPLAGGIGRAVGQAAGATGDVAVDVSSGVVPAACGARKRDAAS